MNRINILIIDDEALVREGLASLLKREDFVRELHEASGLKDCFEKMAVHRIDLILLDMRLQDASGLEILTAIKKKRIPPKIIAVTGLEGAELVIAMLKKGIDGIVHKLDGYKEILAAIRAVMGPHGTYFQEKTIRIIQNNAARWDAAPPVTLTYAERDMLKAIAMGYTTKEISVHLKMAEPTAETYRVRLIRKLNVGNTAALMAYAYRNGLL